MRPLKTELPVKATQQPVPKAVQQAHSPEGTPALRLVSKNRLVLENLEPDSLEPLETPAPAAWRSDRQARAFSAPARVWSAPSRD